MSSIIGEYIDRYSVLAFVYCWLCSLSVFVRTEIDAAQIIYLLIYLPSVAEDERDRLVQVLGPSVVHRQRGWGAARDGLAHGHVRPGNACVRLPETTHRWNLRRKPRTLPVSFRHAGTQTFADEVLKNLCRCSDVETYFTSVTMQLGYVASATDGARCRRMKSSVWRSEVEAHHRCTLQY